MKSSQQHKKQFVFGSYLYKYNLILEERKTLSLSVTPDLQIYLKSPRQAEQSRIDAFLQRKWSWLEEQLDFFKKHQKKPHQKEYISGESVYYLGRQYKLVIKHAREDRVSLSKGQLTLSTTKNIYDSSHTKKVLDDWYNQKIDIIFPERFEQMKLKFDYKNMPTLKIREMKNRWGSYMQSGKVLLNPRLIYASKECIDYVIVHELCHVKYKGHNKFFFAYLSEKYPKWEKVKEKLERSTS